MKQIAEVIICLIIPFLGTTLGSRNGIFNEK